MNAHRRIARVRMKCGAEVCILDGRASTAYLRRSLGEAVKGVTATGALAGYILVTWDRDGTVGSAYESTNGSPFASAHILHNRRAHQRCAGPIKALEISIPQRYAPRVPDSRRIYDCLVASL